MKFWTIYEAINRTPTDQRRELLDAVATDQMTDIVMSSAADFDKKGLANFGTVGHRIYWGPPVGDKRRAIVGDCTDQSKFGSYYVATNKKRTQGVTRSNLRGVFDLGVDGTWRLASLQVLEDVPC